MPKKNSLSIKVLKARLERAENLLALYRQSWAKLQAEQRDWQRKALELEAKVKLMRLVVGKEGV